jgi:hypothetical protein
MKETEMGYRGSKSEFQYPQPNETSVKEQRVDGSYCNKNILMQLRYTLMGFERYYQLKYPSKQLNKRTFSSLNLKSNLSPWFITGFSDAESCFSIKIQENDKLNTKWRVRPVFSIILHKKDVLLLEAIQNNLGVGKILKNGKNAIMYSVDSIKEMAIIINHFDKYPLITQKLSDYLIFKECFEIIKQGKHLTKIGLLQIIGLKYSLNLGLPKKLKFAFPNILIKNRPNYYFKGIPDPFWLSGFTSGDGSFHFVQRKSDSKTDQQLFHFLARFSILIYLHVRELDVLKGIVIFLKKYNMVNTTNEKESSKNSYYSSSNFKINVQERANSVQLQISNLSDINNIIIPYPLPLPLWVGEGVVEYPILGMKSLDFADFKKGCEILKNKKHLNSSSFLNQIIEIKSGMNLNRK